MSLCHQHKREVIRERDGLVFIVVPSKVQRRAKATRLLGNGTIVSSKHHCNAPTTKLIYARSTLMNSMNLTNVYTNIVYTHKIRSSN